MTDHAYWLLSLKLGHRDCGIAWNVLYTPCSITNLRLLDIPPRVHTLIKFSFNGLRTSINVSQAVPESGSPPDTNPYNLANTFLNVKYMHSGVRGGEKLSPGSVTEASSSTHSSRSNIIRTSFRDRSPDLIPQHGFPIL